MQAISKALKNGSGKIEINLPASCDILEINNPSIEINRVDFENNLSMLIPDHISGKLALVISDKTRLCGYEIYLRWVLDVVEKKGFSKDDICIYIAYGTHPIQSDIESLNAYGEVFKQYTFVHHDCDNSDTMLTIGETSSGTPVTVRKEIVESDLVILFGAISHHYFAGYGGGRKLIFPGLGSRESIYHNHKLFIDFDKHRLNPGCQSGVLDGNPVAEDLKEFDTFFPEKILISGILNKSGEVTRLLIGKNYDDFLVACETYDKIYRKRGVDQYDLVIASSGGYPKDINFIQAHKSIHNAASFVKDGGKLIILGECRDGLGNESFIKVFDNKMEEAVEALRSHYSGNGGTALSMMTKSERINIFMLTSLDDITCKKLGVTRITADMINDIIASNSGTSALLENASIMYR